MGKKIFAAALLLAMLLSLASCGGGTTDKGEVNTSPGTTTQPTQGPETEPPQPTEEPAAAVNFIFSARPGAAYEVTGLDLHSVYEGNYVDNAGDVFDNIPFVKLTPGENSFILFCMYSDDESMLHSAATVHSPAGSSPWEGKTYSCVDEYVDNLPDGYTMLERRSWAGPYVFNETNNSGEYYSSLIAWQDWIQFSELYHPDAAEDDAIYVVDVIPYSGIEDCDTIEECLVKLVKTFADLGASATEIDVDEALARCHVEVE